MSDPTPHDDDAERIVLGAMMIDPSVIEAITDTITSAAYYRPQHGTIHAHILAAWSAGQPTEQVALAARMAAAGDLARLDGGAGYLHQCVSEVPIAAHGPYYAGIVANHAAQRNLAVFGTRIIELAKVADPAVRAAGTAEIRAELDGGPTGKARPRAEPLAWPTFLTAAFGPVDFLAGRLLVRGQQMTLIGDGKAGKSLFAQEWAWRIAAGLEFLGDTAHAPLRVLYVDQENTGEEIQERLLSFGATAESLRNLTYLSFPLFRPLNTEAGAGDLLAAVDEDRPAVLVLDTISRMIDGKENDADTWLDLYRHTLLKLKARKVSSIRLDHFGKDASRGGRGNSAKTQDVDAVWELVPTERGSDLLRLTRTHTRDGKGESELLIRRNAEQVGDRWKSAGTWHGLAAESEIPSFTPDPTKQYPPAALRVLGVLGGSKLPLTVSQIADLLAAQSRGPLKRRTVQDALQKLAEASEVDEVDAQKGKASFWTAARS